MTSTQEAKKPSRRPRTSARLAAVQALYQMEITGAPLQDVILEFRAYHLPKHDADNSFGPADPKFFEQILSEASKNLDALDAAVSKCLSADWSLTRLETLVRAILRLGALELIARPDIPGPVVISEYVDVTHAFFVDKEPGFVNGVLNKFARTCRPAEEFLAGGAPSR